MYEVALSVAYCLQANTHVSVAWAIDARGFSATEKAGALMLTPGGGRVGSLLSGAFDEQLAEVAGRGSIARMVALEISEIDALVSGLPVGVSATCLVVPADRLPADLWPNLVDNQPVCLLTHLDGNEVTSSELFTSGTIAAASDDARRLFERGESDTSLVDGVVTTILWPVPRLVLAGGGPMGVAMAEALQTMAATQLGWQVRRVSEVAEAVSAVSALTKLDSIVVLGHDLDLAGEVLLSALDGNVGYIGALGGRQVQQARYAWLAERGVEDVSRIHGPAGFDIGARTPAEIALSVLAEAVAVGRQGNA